MRGREPCVDVRLDFCGITPAYAGKSESYGLPALPRWDHPRVCGEELPRLLSLALALGSPPRMRGRAASGIRSHAAAGITPAYAGKRHMGHAALLVHRDHPRVCGEEACMQCTLQGHGGSPPRMRGRASAWPPVLRPPKDHPRVCGEEIDRQGHHADDWGSPPRMRGRGPQRGPGRGAPGITPAYAGKSCSSTGRAGGRGDHPRVCGEEAYCFVVCRCSVGSPPRMRGRALLHCTVQT